MAPKPRISIDLGINSWSLRDQMAYRKEVGVNPQFAFAQIVKAFDGMEGGVIPDAALNIPPEYLVGMAWVTMRRKRNDITLDDVVDVAGTFDALFEAFAAAMDVLAEDVDERPTDAGTESPAPATD